MYNIGFFLGSYVQGDPGYPFYSGKCMVSGVMIFDMSEHITRIVCDSPTQNETQL